MAFAKTKELLQYTKRMQRIRQELKERSVDMYNSIFGRSFLLEPEDFSETDKSDE